LPARNDAPDIITSPPAPLVFTLAFQLIFAMIFHYQFFIFRHRRVTPLITAIIIFAFSLILSFVRFSSCFLWRGPYDVFAADAQPPYDAAIIFANLPMFSSADIDIIFTIQYYFSPPASYSFTAFACRHFYLSDVSPAVRPLKERCF